MGIRVFQDHGIWRSVLGTGLALEHFDFFKKSLTLAS